MGARRISTHVLDIARGRPAAGVGVALDAGDGHGAWRAAGAGRTDANGRFEVVPESPLPPGVYRLTFDTRPYFEAQGVASFHPSIAVTFETTGDEAHYHVPLLVGPFGYTTYRGS